MRGYNGVLELPTAVYGYDGLKKSAFFLTYIVFRGWFPFSNTLVYSASPTRTVAVVVVFAFGFKVVSDAGCWTHSSGNKTSTPHVWHGSQWHFACDRAFTFSVLKAHGEQQGEEDTILLLRGTIVNRTYVTHKTLDI